MKREGQLAAAFILALLVHLGAAMGVSAYFAQRPDLVLEFRTGESSVELTLVAPMPLEPIPEPEPVDQDEVVIEEREAVTPPERDKVPPENDADILLKGVESDWESMQEIRPRYPVAARMRGEQGIVTLEIMVTAKGRATSVRVVKTSGYPALDQAAVRAAQAGRYRCTTGDASNGGVLTMDFQFVLIE